MFDTFELSRFLGRPVRLFQFTRQSKVWRFAQADRDLVIGGNTWLAAQIERDEIRQTVERAKDKLTIRLAYLPDPDAPADLVPSTQPLGDIWRPYIPSDQITVICLEAHYGDTDPPKVEWMGEVAQPAFTDTQLELTCVPGRAIAEAVNQGPKWQRGCWKVPYSQGSRGCGMDPADFEVPATLTEVDGLTLTAAEFASAPLSLLQGELRWTRSNGLIERRTIVSHTLGSDTVRLLYGGEELAAALAVVALPSCEQTWAACEVRFVDPENHYGGAIYMPVENPMEGVSMSWG